MPEQQLGTRAGAATVLAFDYGLRQIGVAVGNSLLATSQPLCVLQARDGIPDWAQIAALVAEWQPGLIVVGDPLNMDGTVSPLALRARKFARWTVTRRN